MSQTQANAERIRNAYAQWNATKGASPEAFLDLMAEDVRMKTNLAPPELHPLAHERTGIENARDYLVSLVLHLEMIDFPTEEIVAQGDTVVWIGSCAWRDRKTGEETDTRKVDVWRFKDGKVVDVLEMFDTLGFARLNGLLPA
jgi:ketosteroid isomerase-like protein